MLNSKQQQTLNHLKDLGRFGDFYLVEAFGLEKAKAHKRFIIKRGMFNWLLSLDSTQLNTLINLPDYDNPNRLDPIINV